MASVPLDVPASPLDLALSRAATKLDALDFLQLAEPLFKSGEFNPMAILPKDHRNGFLAAWVQESAERNGSISGTVPNIAVFEAFERWTGGKVWTQTNKAGETPIEVWLRHWDSSYPYYEKANLELAYMVEHTDLSVLKKWSSDQPGADASKRFDSHSRNASLVSYLVKRAAEPALHLLFEKGFNLLGNKGPSSPTPVAADIRRASLWDAFLQQGGDPNIMFASHDNKQVTLWEHLRHESKTYAGATDEAAMTALNERVMAWVADHASDGLAKRQREEYWAKFDNNAVQDLDKHMKTIPEWPTLQDDQGRSAMMRLTLKKPQLVKSFTSVQKSKSGAALLDHQGRSLWHYMLKDGRAHSSSVDSQKWLSDNVPVTLDHQGHGLVSECLAGEGTSGHGVLPEIWSKSVWTKTADRSDFWWGNKDSQLLLADWIVNQQHLGTRHSGSGIQATTNWLDKPLRTIAENVTTDGMHPHLLGALVANELFAFNLDEEKRQRVHRLLDAGALLNISDERRPFLTDRHNAQSLDLQAIFSKFEANELRAGMTASDDTPVPTRPRSRL